MKYLVMILMLLPGLVLAGGNKNNCYKCEFNNYYSEENYYDYSTQGIDSSDFYSAYAANMAASAIDCNTSTRKNQAGFGLGNASGQSAFAAGYCKSIGQSPEYSQTIGVKGAFADGLKPGWSVGYNIAW